MKEYRIMKDNNGNLERPYFVEVKCHFWIFVYWDRVTRRIENVGDVDFIETPHFSSVEEAEAYIRLLETKKKNGLEVVKKITV